jgi:signal transduction histidine kinase
LVGIVVAALAMAALLVPSNMTAFPPEARLAAIGVGLAIAASGMVAWERRPANPIGPFLVLAGVLWIVGRMQGAAWAPLGLTANLANSLAQAVLIAILIAFPTGRITSRAGWAIVILAVVSIVGANLSQVMALETRHTAAIDGPNPLYVPMDPAVRTVLQVGFQLGVYVSALGGFAWLIARWWRASRPARRTYTPIFAAGIAIGVISLVTEMLVDRGGLTPAETQTVQTIQILAFALFPAGILVGVLRDRMARGAVADLVVELGDNPPPERLQEALARTLGDPSLEIVYWSEPFRGYVDGDGTPVELPTNDEERGVTLLERSGKPLAAILHDPTLADDPKLVAAVGAASWLAIDNDRLNQEVRSQLAEVRASRSRIVEAADAERRRIERNLHDGAQQRLVALSLALRRARALVPADAEPDLSSTLEAASEQLRTALAELRELARGIHPAILTSAGLGPALQSLAGDSIVPVAVAIDLPEDVPDSVAVAVYFVVAEALANVAKYADATQVELTAASDGDELRIEVADDGRGGADRSAGSGLRGLDDRVAALGGRLDVRSPAGQGTQIVARLPLTAGSESGS